MLALLGGGDDAAANYPPPAELFVDVSPVADDAADAAACLEALLRPATRLTLRARAPEEKSIKPKGGAPSSSSLEKKAAKGLMKKQPALLLKRPGAAAAARADASPPRRPFEDTPETEANPARCAAPSALANVAARAAVGDMLKTRLGDPAETLKAVASDLAAASIDGSADERAHLVCLVDAMEREIARVADARPASTPDDLTKALADDDDDDDDDASDDGGDSDADKDPAPPWPVAFFFRQNRGVCDAWLEALRADAAACAVKAGLFAAAAYHADQACADAARRYAESGEDDGDDARAAAEKRFDAALGAAALARVALGDAAACRGLKKWRADVLDDGDAWWLNAAVDARGRAFEPRFSRRRGPGPSSTTRVRSTYDPNRYPRQLPSARASDANLLPNPILR